MTQTYQARRRTRETAAEQKLHTGAPGPSLSELAAGAMPSAEQMGHRVDLPGAIREKMEASFGADFSGVKLYESQTVADAGAEAMTMGSSVAFAPGQLDFASTSGQALLGHELSHVVSQARGESASRGFLADSGLEAQADRQGMLAAQGESVYTGPVTPLSASAVSASAGPIQAAGKSLDDADREELALNDAAENQEGLVTTANLPGRFHFIKRGQSLARLRRMRAERLARERQSTPESRRIWAQVEAMQAVAAERTGNPLSGANYDEAMEQAAAAIDDQEPAPPVTDPAPPAAEPSPPATEPGLPVTEPVPAPPPQNILTEPAPPAAEPAPAPVEELQEETPDEGMPEVSEEQVARLVGPTDERGRAIEAYLRGSMGFHTQEERDRMFEAIHPSRQGEGGQEKLLQYVAGDIRKFLKRDIRGLNAKSDQEVLNARRDLAGTGDLMKAIQSVLPYVPEKELRTMLGRGKGMRKNNKLDKFNRKAERFRKAMRGAKRTVHLYHEQERGRDITDELKKEHGHRKARRLDSKKMRRG